MPKICFYFQLHQPYRLADMSVFDVNGEIKDYFTDDQELNKQVFTKVAEKSYVPMLTLLAALLKKHPDFRFTFSASGVFLEQALTYAPQVVKLLADIVATGQVEVLAETYYHSLSSLYSQTEFQAQVLLHQKLVASLFAVQPSAFRNTELIYNNDIAQLVEDMGYVGMLTEGVDRYLWGRKRTVPYVAKTKNNLPLLLKHAQLSDDIAFRFSERTWSAWPLTVSRYLEWLYVYPPTESVNLFMDFETFGEHQWADTGIFIFFEQLIEQLCHDHWNEFVTPTQVFTPLCDRKITKHCFDKKKQDVYDVPETISWADIDRDITAWRDNHLQQDSLRLLYELETKVLTSGDTQLITDWRKLQISDHFYYMCTKWANDGDVHAYFSPYQDPYEAYRRYSIILADLHERMM
jgi:alpha-amylase